MARLSISLLVVLAKRPLRAQKLQIYKGLSQYFGLDWVTKARHI